MSARGVLVLALVSACASSSPRSGGGDVGTPGANLFADRCEGCHADGEAGRPRLVAAELTPRAANHALKMLLRGAMPPGGTRLPRAEVLLLGDWLCATSGRDRAACRALVHGERRLGPTGAAFLAAVRHAGPQLPKDDSFFVRQIRDHLRKSVSSQVLDPTMTLLASALALETCAPAPTTSTGATAATAVPATPASHPVAFARCFDAILEAMLRPIIPPPDAEEP